MYKTEVSDFRFYKSNTILTVASSVVKESNWERACLSVSARRFTTTPAATDE
jgi:hypothetical protein